MFNCLFLLDAAIAINPLIKLVIKVDSSHSDKSNNILRNNSSSFSFDIYSYSSVEISASNEISIKSKL